MVERGYDPAARPMRGRRGRLPVMATAAMLLAIPLAARAANTCDGTIRTTAMHALPPNAAVALARPLEDTANPDLSRRFVDGLQRSDVRSDANGRMTLRLSADVRAPDGRPVVQSGRHGGFANFDWTGRLPMTADHKAGLRGATVTLTVQLIDRKSARISWVAAIKCTVTTDDPGALAEELGQVIGQSIGRNSYPRPL